MGPNSLSIKGLFILGLSYANVSGRNKTIRLGDGLVRKSEGLDAQKLDALSGFSSLTDASHDALARFTLDLETFAGAPDFWSCDTPVWFGAPIKDMALSFWPVMARRGDKIALTCPSAMRPFWVFERDAFKAIEKNTGSALSGAELRLAADLVQGLSLSDSAKNSGIATATRRKQLQTLSRKLNVSGQVELVALISRAIQQFTMELSADSEVFSPAPPAGDTSFFQYRKFLPEGARCGVLGGPDGRVVRYLDIGPPTGRPVMILHSMVFPHIDAEDVAQFHALGWRTLWPIRPGCLERTAHRNLSWQCHCDRAVEDMRVLADAMTDKPIALLPLVSATAYAVRFAEIFPQKVARLDFVATCFSAGKDGPEDYFFDRMMHRISKNSRIAAIAVAHVARSIGNKRQLEVTTRRVFSDSGVDQQQLDEEFATQVRRARFEMASLGSLDSVRLDYFSQIHFSWDRARSLSQPINFWHGVEDRVNNLAQVTRLSRSVANKAPHAVRGLGHLTQGAPMRTAYQAIAADFEG